MIRNNYKSLKTVLMTAVILLLSACKGKVNPDLDGSTAGQAGADPSVTVGAEYISAVSVVLKGETNLEAQMSSDMTMGIMWSENSGVLPSNSTKIEAKNIEAKEGSTTSYCYSVNLTGLEPAKSYHFRSYVNQDGRDTYGYTKSFTTQALSTMFEAREATEVGPTSANMNAKLDLTDVQYTTMDYGFYWGTSEDSQTTYVKGGEIAENAYFASLSDLSHKTQYWYKAYLKVDDQEFYGAVKTFTTDVVPVKGVTLDKNACTVHTIDSTFTLAPTVSPKDATNKALSWDSSNTSVATVDTKGKVTTKGNGTTTITATTKDQGKTATCEVTVAQWVTGITLDKTTLTLNEGQTATLAPTVSPSNAKDKSVTWSSSNTAVAAVDQNGKVTAVEKGTATIKATANDGSGKSASCSVTVNKLVSTITLDKTSIAIYNGKTATITATVLPETANNRELTWTSSNTSIATVSSSGVVTGVAKGNATITATAKDGSGKSASCQVEVKQYVTGITLNKTSVTLDQGQTVTLTTTVSPSNANDKSVTWSSSSTAVATVDQNGKVTAVSKGTTTIKATAKDGSGKSASCFVGVLSTSPTDLSANGRANCYIVSAPGTYSFPATKGNTSTSVGSVASAAVLWESFGTSVQPSVGDIVFAVYKDGRIVFGTPATLKNGNAVIAAKDAGGTILWSWHIWVCSGYNPSSSAQTYYHSAGTMMDRNLGATSATPGNVGALGLLYQWGRKDPFLGICRARSDTKAASTLSWPSPVETNSSKGTVAYAVKNPTTFIGGVQGTEFDWVYSSRDNALWKSSKTIYDPCPSGWKVPTGGSNGIWSKAYAGGADKRWDKTNTGANFSKDFGSASTIWYPAAGFLRYKSGSYSGNPTYSAHGYYWSCTISENWAYSLLFYSINSEKQLSDNKAYLWYRAAACSVRCLKE